MRGFLTKLVTIWLSLTVILSACSSGGGSDRAPDNEQASGQDEQSQTTKVSMVYWPGPESEAMQKVIDAYNAGQGKNDGVNVEMVLLSRDGTYEREAVMMSGNSDEVDMYFTASYIIGQHAPYLDPLDGKVSTDNYLASSVESLQVEGQTLAIPMDVSNHFLLYRTDLMEQLLTDDAWKTKYGQISQQVVGQALTPKDPAEWTWDDFIAAAAFFSKAYNGDSPTEFGTALQLKNLMFNTMIWNDVLWSYGGSWLSAEGKPDLVSEAAHKAMEVYSKIYSGKMTSPNSTVAEYPETQAALQSGSVAFAIQWGAAYNELNNPELSPQIAGKIGTAPIPGEHKTHVHSLGVALNKYAKHKDAALKWMNYLTTEEAMTIYAQSGGIPPISNVLNQLGDKNAVLPLIAEHVEKYGYSEPILPQTQTIMTKLAEVLSGAWIGLQPIDEALETAQQEISSILSK